MVQGISPRPVELRPRTPAPRKKIPPAVARVEPSRCSGCEVCIVFCPVDCIALLPDPDGGVNPIAWVVEEECIGCRICPRECPWEAIEMAPPSASAPALQAPYAAAGARSEGGEAP